MFSTSSPRTRLGEGGGVGDGEGDIQNPGQGPGEQGLARSGWADEEDVALLELHVVAGERIDGADLRGGLLEDPLVVVVDGDREDLLGAVLTDHVLIEAGRLMSAGLGTGSRFWPACSPP
jgi:hypothetical protein